MANIINEDAIIGENYILNGDPKLWPEMEWSVIPWMSPFCILSYKIAIPIALVIFALLLCKSISLGLFASISFLLIWTLYCKRISKIHWAEVLHSGEWVDAVDKNTKEKILNSDFIINRSNGRVYNKNEEGFVKRYREEHPHWFRHDWQKDAAKLPYNDEYHYVILMYDNGFKELSKKVGFKIPFPSREGIWVTKEEYDKLWEKINSIPYSSDNVNNVYGEFIKKVKQEIYETNTKSI